MSGRFPSRILASAVVLLLAACAEQQAPINRVQPNYYDKSFFVGQDYQGTQDDPEFYSQATLVDVGYGAGQDGLFTSTYAQPLARVKWTVTEDMLVARSAYERVAGSDGKGLGKATNDGIVVAAYRIQSHFDIKRQYNPTTGEQLNVIEENSVDRPWYQRQYMHVDFSKNLSTDNYDFDMLSMLGVFGGVTYEPLAYTVLDPKDADAPHMDDAAGYLDITNKAFARPQVIDLSIFGAGSIPACFLDADIGGGAAPATGCSPVELTVRQSFLKITDHDYEPADWDGYRFQAFGAFTTERFGYARDYGMTDTLWHRFINRYNIWERSHVYTDAANMTGPVACYTSATTPVGADPHRDLNNDGTEDECAAVGRGSRCDTFKQRCTLPFRDRNQVTIAWYYAQGSAPEYFEPTRDAAHEWDVALRSSVLAARYAECNRTHDSDCASKYPVYNGQQDDNWDAVQLAKEVDDCRAGIAWAGTPDCTTLADTIGAKRHYSAGVIALAKLPEAIVLCHSPVEANDPAACGSPRLPASTTAAQCYTALVNNDAATLAICDAALNVRKGDLRYHHVNSIVAPQTPSPWGIMVDSHDPLTGEKVAASINIWSHVTDLASQGLVDTARYIKGELATSDVTDGTYVRDWAAAAAAASGGSGLAPMTAAEHDSYLSNLLNTDLATVKAGTPAFKGSPVGKQLMSIAHDAENVKADAKASSTKQPIYEARRQRALGTQTEAALMTSNMQSYAGGNGKLGSDLVLALGSPLRGANPSAIRNYQQAKELMLAERGACIINEAPAPLAIADLANVLEAKFGPFNPGASKDDQAAHAERIRKYIAQRMHYGVIVHEMGHSMGLRHNFVTSADPLNYRPQYWQLRTDNGTNTTKCTDLNTPANCVGPRYYDPLNQNERDNLIAMFMQSSTMDYPGEVTQDTIALGTYDFAAARMFYGDVVPVLADDSYKLGTPRYWGMINKMDNFGGIIGVRYVVGNNDASDPTGTTDIHYSELQANYELIKDCVTVDPSDFRPGIWNDTTMGTFHPVFDGLIVAVNGEYKRCRQQPVDYVNWNQMRSADADTEGGSDRTANNIDPAGRPRMPYGFATDRWADLGNLSVYRHDNGADPYEFFDFLITQQEVNHIFDNYRRNRQTFSVRNASNRTLTRYNEKLRDAAKGLTLMSNVYKDFAAGAGYDFASLWPYIANANYHDNLLASSMGFDHFARQVARPEAGEHYSEGTGLSRILRSSTDSAGNPGSTNVIIPNGATGLFGNVSFGGRPMENALATTKGEYDAEYTMNVGMYYDKAWASMLMTESVDNFISSARRDFLDARYRACSVADLFPDGYRRWLGNNLTGDDAIKGPRIESSASGAPKVDADKYPTSGIAYTSWTGTTAQTCFVSNSSQLCTATPPANSVAIDPEVGWEQQKFLIAYTLLYLPENAQQEWLNQMGIWEIGADTDPGFANRIELHLPDGKTYVAKTYGRETVLGKTVQKGISARILEWANVLLAQAYVHTDVDTDGDGVTDWYVPTLVNGQPVVKYDSSVTTITANGGTSNGRTGCNSTDNSQCTCSSNKACIALSKYEEVPFFMRQAMRDYGLAFPSMKGIY
jgi:hypothetical protein